MNFKYIDYNKSNYKKEIKKLYINSFAREERYPFWLVKSCAKGENVEFNVIIDKNKLIGMEYLLKYNNTVYLFYLAIGLNQRGNGYGSKVLADLLERYKDKSIILCIERPDENNETDIRIRRKKFYLKNGFYSTNKYTEDNGVEYEVLCTNKELNVTKEVLEDLYKQMSKTFISGYIISKLYNVEYVHFIK